MNLEVRDIVCGYGQGAVLDRVSLSVNSGEILCLLGPNGVGKTTLFKAILGLLKIDSGSIFINGRDISELTGAALAREIAYVPQAHTPPFPFSVMDVVLMGRTAHIGPFASPSDNDRTIAESALAILGISSLKERIYTEISGGERQMVLVARALTQQAKILVLHEPTSNLDFGNQVRVLEQIGLLAKQGLSIIMTTHFPNHAFLCSTRVILMQRNHVLVTGSPDEIITETNLRAAYGVDVKITETDTGSGFPIKSCIPLMRENLKGCA